MAATEEVASALAYLELCGNDPGIEALAARLLERDEPVPAMLQRLAPLAAAVDQQRTFTERLDQVVAEAAFAEASHTVADNLQAVSDAALRVFAGSFDFFALHLVTGSHAYRLLYDFVGPQRTRSSRWG